MPKTKTSKKESIKSRLENIIQSENIDSVDTSEIEDEVENHPEEVIETEEKITEKEKDIIVSTVRPNLKSFAIVTKEFDNFVCSTGFAVLRAKEEKVHPTYLFYLTFYDDVFLAQILPIIVGSNYPAINSYDVYELIIPLPTLPEQHRIASILSQIDEAIEKEQKYKEKLERIKRGLMEDLLTGKVRVNHLIEEGVELPQEA